MQYLQHKNQSHNEDGFSLVETLIAAIVMLVLLVGSNRMMMQGMASSGRASQRAEIEQEIINDIEKIQEIDTLLSKEPQLSNACSSGIKHSSKYLAQELSEANSTNWSRSLDTSQLHLLIATYTLETFSNEKEVRVMELNPSFPSACPTP